MSMVRALSILFQPAAQLCMYVCMCVCMYVCVYVCQSTYNAPSSEFVQPENSECRIRHVGYVARSSKNDRWLLWLEYAQFSLHEKWNNCPHPYLTVGAERTKGERPRWVGEMVVIEPTAAQRRQNAVHVVGQQTASQEVTDAMPDPRPCPRWRRD